MMLDLDDVVADDFVLDVLSVVDVHDFWRFQNCFCEEDEQF
jgi:hypothetical protein